MYVFTESITGGNSGKSAGSICGTVGRTVAIQFIRAICAVWLSIAAQLRVHALAFVALELKLGADGAVHLVAVVCALGDAVAAPRHGDAVDLASSTGELLARARGRL